MDYICIGANGFAQVGNPDYYPKQAIEGKILMNHITKDVPVPEQFQGIAHYRIKAFQHEFGEYHELCLIFDDNVIDRPYDGFEDDLDELSTQFWEFANTAEGFDCESEQIAEEIRCTWQKELDRRNARHLSKAV